MKRIAILSFIGVCIALGINAAEKQDENANKPAFIEVLGTAEMNVSPDSLTLTIRIREREDAKNKKSLSAAETALIQDLQKIGIKKEDLKVVDLGGVWREASSKENKMEYFLTKTFNLKFGSIQMVDRLLEAIDRNNVDNIQIISLSNTKLKEYQKQTRAKALEAAREKADYLLKSQNKELGEILFIIEQENGSYQPFSHKSSNVLLSYQNQEQGNLENFRKINLHYAIKVRFEIK